MSETDRVKRGREALDGVRKAATYVRDVVRKIPATQGLPIWTEEMTLQSFIDELQRSNDALYGPLNVLLKRVKSNAAKYIVVKEQDNGYKGLFFRKPAIPAPRTDYDQFGCVNVGFYGGLLTIKDDADMGCCVGRSGCRAELPMATGHHKALGKQELDSQCP